MEKRKVFLVEVIRASGPKYWYRHHIGKQFWVIESNVFKEDYRLVSIYLKTSVTCGITSFTNKLFTKEDCEILKCAYFIQDSQQLECLSH